MTRFALPLSIVTLAAAALLTACNNSAPAPSAAAVPLPANLRLTAAPAEAQAVAAVRAAAKEGQRIVVTGKIAGRKDPIGENRAILTLLDTSIKTCDQEEGDACKTPWDACCEPGDSIAKNSLSVQVPDAKGDPLHASLTAVEGIKPLAKVTIAGTAHVSGDGIVTIDADGIYVMQ